MGLLSKTENEDQGPAPLTVDVDPAELDVFRECQGALERARRAADSVPAEIVDEAGKSLATDALKALRDARRDADDARKRLTRGFDDAKKRIKAAFDEAMSPAKAAEESIGDRMLKREREEREAAEAQRRVEEAEARKAQEEENRKAEEEGRASHHVAPPAPKKRPTGGRGASGAKASPTKELKYEITDLALLPDEYVERVPRRSKIQADVRAGIVIPGVRPYRDESVRVR